MKAFAALTVGTLVLAGMVTGCSTNADTFVPAAVRCADELGITAKTSARDELLAYGRHSLDKARLTGVVETYYEDAVEVTRQIVNPKSELEARAIVYDFETGKGYPFGDGDAMYIDDLSDSLDEYGQDQVSRKNANTFEVKIDGILTARISIQDCLISDATQIEDNWSQTFAYTFLPQDTQMLKSVNEEYYGGAETLLDSIEENHTADVNGNVKSFPIQIPGYQLDYQTQVESFRLFEGDSWYMPLSEFDGGTDMSCGERIWVLKWRSQNPDVVIRVVFGLNDAGEFSSFDSGKTGGRGYMKNASCTAPGFMFEGTRNSNGSTLVDVNYELQMWSSVPTT